MKGYVGDKTAGTGVWWYRVHVCTYYSLKESKSKYRGWGSVGWWLNGDDILAEHSKRSSESERRNQ